MRELNLIVPGLAAWRESPHGDPHPMPGLEALLARGHPLGGETSLADCLCRAFGIERQQDIPLAPITAAFDGLDVRRGYWLRADPVHLQVGMRGMTLLDAGHVGLDAEESGTLAAALAPLFAAAGWRLHAPHPERWYANPPTHAISLSTTPLDQVATRHVNSALPVGQSAPDVMRLLNDAQVLLHGHPVNRAREARGQATINSLWLWGGGVAPTTTRNYSLVLAEQPEARALAAYTRANGGPCPSRLNQIPRVENALLALPEFPPYATAEDAARLDSDWFLPLLRALRQGHFHHVTLALSGPDGKNLGLGMLDAWKVWKKTALD